jgi:pilus assembly protein CpaD
MAALSVAMAAVFALPGCRDDAGDPVAGWSTIDPMVNHPIAVGVRPYHLALDLPEDDRGLTRQQADDARRFLRRYRLQGETALAIDMPEYARGSLADAQLQAILAGEAVPPRAIRYISEGGYGNSITMAFETGYVAHPPECGYWPGNLSESRENTPYWNFGCAQSRNLAMMVANPNDLIGPRRSSPRASDRRDVIWRKYIGGEETSATADQVEQNADVSAAQ